MSVSTGTGAGHGLGLDFLSGTVDADVFERPTPAARNKHGHLDADSEDPDSAYIFTTTPSKSSSFGTEGIPLHEPGPINQSALARHGTLLSFNATPGRNAAELRTILGSSRSRLKPGAALLPPERNSCGADSTSLEQAKSRARVEVDIILDSKICVQGGYLQGHVTILVQKCTNSETPVLVSSGKIRVIGFESISNHPNRYPFYQCSLPLSTVTTTSEGLSDLLYDAEGFARAVEGEHRLPFSMYLPMSADHGVPKGALYVHSGVTVRYIAMVSIKVKDPVSDSRSIAHFYRDCEIWPRLNPSVILAPAARPLQVTIRKSIFMGGSGKVDLTSSVHRLHWIAGQQCFVKFSIVNGSKKMINSLALALVRSAVVFKPDRRLDTLDDAHNMDPDACQTSTTQKQVAESVLELGRRAIRGHASAKGWWSGVAPGEHREFYHSILLPPDALSVTRSRLLEINYFIRVTLGAGPLRTSDIQASLPIRIVNFLSVDPPPSCPLPDTGSLDQSVPRLSVERTYMRPQHTYRPHVAGSFGYHDINFRALGSLAEADEEKRSSAGHSSHSAGSEDESLGPENAYEGIDEFNDESPPDTGRGEIYVNQNEDLRDLTIYEDDADEIISHIIHIDPEYANAPRFADLYHVSCQEGVCQSARSGLEDNAPQQNTAFPTKYQAPPGENGLEKLTLGNGSSGGEYDPELRPKARSPLDRSRFGLLQGPSSFAQRVQIKMEAAAATSNLRLSSGDVSLAHGETPTVVMHTEVGPASSTEQTATLLPNDSMPRYMQDHTQRSTDFPVHLQFQNCDNDATTVICSQRTAGFEERPDCHTALHFVTNSESATSLPYRKVPSSGFSNMSGGGESGSRLLPKPPSIMNVSHTTAFIAPSTALAGIALPSVTLLPFTTADRPGLRCESQHLSQDLSVGELSQKDDKCCHKTTVSVDSRLDIATRPSILALKEHTGSSMGGSSNSVKERIRELEERQRLLQLSEL